MITKTRILLFNVFVVGTIFSSCFNNKTTPNTTLGNDKIELVFNEKTGALIRFSNPEKKYNFLSDQLSSQSLWEIELLLPSGIKKIDRMSSSRFHISKLNSNCLALTWDDFKDTEINGLKVIATVKLEENQPQSLWKITVEGTAGKTLSKVVFPIISGIKNLDEEKLAAPAWMGVLMTDPRDYLEKQGGEEKKFEWQYPGRMSLQCIALYNDIQKFGLYTACNDSLAYRKDFLYTLDSVKNLTYKIYNYPALDSVSTSYTPSYEAIIGSFKGDWISAAALYRQWGSKQKWALNSRLKKGLTSKWLEQTALWEWNRGKSGNVLGPAEDLEKRLNLPINVFWHWWHGCSYDDGFPEYFPPREAKESFIKAITKAQDAGLEAIVYMNQMQWGTETASWTKENAQAYAVKDINGNLNTHLYNVFTNKTLTTMCMGTQFWKDKYTSLCDTAVNSYQTNGVYMDQACFSFLCYDKTHGHSVGGGNYWLRNFGELTEQIRSTFPKNKDVFLAGEGVSEAWLPYLDAFLTLQVSMERYAGDNGWEPIPFFQAVYHQYGITYGSYSSLIVPPYDELWPKKYAPKDPMELLDKSYNKQFMMEQARSFVWGLQPTIANYQPFLSSERKEEIDFLLDLARVRYKGLKYLLHGKFVRSPDMAYPKEMFQMSKLSIYAGKTGQSVKTFQKEYPVVFSGNWQADDGQIGIALASISDAPYSLRFHMNNNDYGLFPTGKIKVITADGEKELGAYTDGEIDIDYTLKPKQICIIEIIPNN